jgi:hypothetical protein
MIADAVLEKQYVTGVLAKRATQLMKIRKENQVGQVFAHKFTWSEAIDAAADVYNGVSEQLQYMLSAHTVTVCFLVNIDLFGGCRMV